MNQIPGRSIPHVTFVVLNSVAVQEFSELLLERNLPVVRLLSRDVFADGLDLRKADGENAVAILPGELPQAGAFGFEPERGAAFDLLDHFRRRAGARQERM